MAETTLTLKAREWASRPSPDFFSDETESAYNRETVAKLAARNQIVDVHDLEPLWRELRQAGDRFLYEYGLEEDRQKLPTIRAQLESAETLSHRLSIELDKLLQPRRSELSAYRLLHEADTRARLRYQIAPGNYENTITGERPSTNKLEAHYAREADTGTIIDPAPGYERARKAISYLHELLSEARSGLEMLSADQRALPREEQRLAFQEGKPRKNAARNWSKVIIDYWTGQLGRTFSASKDSQYPSHLQHFALDAFEPLWVELTGANRKWRTEPIAKSILTAIEGQRPKKSQ